MKTAPDSARITKLVQQELPQSRALWLFGSATRGDMQNDSDIDLAVTLPEPLDAQEKWELQIRLGRQLGFDVDLLDFARLPTIMQLQIIETGQLLFAKDPLATEMYNAFVRTEYLDIQRWRQPMIVQLAADLSRA